jgi:predicted MFS family arabinose efflux permease
MGAGVMFWGLGFAAFNSMQQARLIAAAPALASASVALNTSFIYVGQAAGSALSGLLFARGALHGIGYGAVALLVVALALLLSTRPQGPE